MKKQILIIEDDTTLLGTLTAKFEAEGFVVESYTDAADAFKAMKDKKPDLILTDLVMHDIDGFAVLTKLKNDPSLVQIPAIVLSNQGEPSDITRATELGAKDFIVKADNSLEDIVTKVSKFLHPKKK